MDLIRERPGAVERAPHPPAQHPAPLAGFRPEALLALQRTAGNVAVTRMLRGASPRALVQRMAYDAVTTGSYYTVRLSDGDRVMYLQSKTKVINETRKAPEFDFQPDEHTRAPRVTVGEAAIIAPAFGPPPRASVQAPQIGPPVPSDTRKPTGTVPELRSTVHGTIAYDRGRGAFEIRPLSGLVSEITYLPFGLYSKDKDLTFWSKAAPAKDLAARLEEAAGLIEAGLESRLSPLVWADIRSALTLQAQRKREPRKGGAEAREKGTAAPAASPSAGRQAGEEFLWTHDPLPVSNGIEFDWAGQAPRVGALDASVSEPKKPGYLLSLPCHVSKDPDAILERYASQAGAGRADGLARVAAVLAINARRTLKAGDTPVETALAKTTKDHGMPYGLVGFYWAPQFNVRGDKKTLADVKKEYGQLTPEARAYVDARLYRGHSKQEDLAYGLFRDAAADNVHTDAFMKQLRAVADPVYLHIGDADTVDWAANNAQDTGVLTAYDALLKQLAEGGKTYPILVIGGYNFGLPSNDDTPEHRLVKLGGIVDRAVRRSIAAVLADVLYPTEPNLLVKVFDGAAEAPAAVWDLLTSGAMFGTGDAEGSTLRRNLAKKLGMSIADPGFAPYVDITVETEVPPRIETSAAEHTLPVLNLIQQKQSYLDIKNWTSISRTDKREANAKAALGEAIRKLVMLQLKRTVPPSEQELLEAFLQ